jgi:transposase InsO family protein
MVQIKKYSSENAARTIAANRYNCERKHQSLDYQTPEKLFKKIV